MMETNIDSTKININVLNRIRHRYREKEDVPNKLVITSYMDYEEVVTMGDLFYFGLRFLISNRLADKFYKEIILPTEDNSKTKDTKMEEMFNKISKDKVDILIKYMELNMIYQQYKKISLTRHAMLKMVVRFLTRDFIMVRDKLNEAIKSHIKYGDKEILIWGIIFIIRENSIVTCYYPTKLKRELMEKFKNKHGLDEVNSLLKTLDKIKKMGEEKIGGEVVLCQ